MKVFNNVLLIILLIFTERVIAIKSGVDNVDDFVNYMVSTHHFDRTELQSLFSKTIKSDRVIAAISKPAEAMPWYKYQSLFIQPDRIDHGLLFWRKYESILQKAEDEYGVPARYIVAIIGVETRYGVNKGNDRVMDALYTLAFHYPKRSAFFINELEQFLLLAREQKINPLSLRGSYAGAMGMPQFIPSSYRNYAVDFDHDGKIDIWNNPADAIGSVANYFKEHGWKKGEDVVFPGKVTDKRYQNILTTDMKPEFPVEQLQDYGIYYDKKVSPGTFVDVISLEGKDGDEIWLGLNNFYVITRYNHSPLYAMAVYQLAEAIQNKYLNNNVAEYH